MSPAKTLKVRVALLCILGGTVLALVAVVTDHWAVLSPHVEHHNTTCEAAHFGLWRICTKRIFVGDKERTCGPITLPGGNVPAPPGPVGGRGSPDGSERHRPRLAGGRGASHSGAQGWSGAGVWTGGQTVAQEREHGSTDSAWMPPPAKGSPQVEGLPGGSSFQAEVGTQS